MDLSKYPAQLPPEQADQWRSWIFQLTESTSVLELAGHLERHVKPKKATIRGPLNDFLNGYSREIYRWIGPSPSEKGEALCEVLMERSAPAVLQYFQDLVSQLYRGGFGAKALEHMPLDVEWPKKDSPFRPLQAWLTDQNRTNLLPDIPLGERIGWKEVGDHLRELDEKLAALARRPVIVLRAVNVRESVGGPVNRTGELARRLGEQRLESLQVHSSFVSATTWDGDSGEDVLELEIPFASVSTDNLDRWLETLEDLKYLNLDMKARASRFFSSVPLRSINALSPTHLQYALEDISEGAFEEDAAVFQRRRVAWLRRDLGEGTTPLVRQWLRDTRGFFSRWIEKAGTLQSDVSRPLLYEILESGDDVRPHKEQEALESVLEDRLATTDDDAELRARLLQLLSGSLHTQLHDAGLLESSNNASHRLSEELQALGELELALCLEPSQLSRIDVYASFPVVADAVRFAQPHMLDKWCQAAFDVDDVDLPWAMLAVLHGLSERRNPVSEFEVPSLHRLWASTVWVALFGLYDYAVGSLDSSASRIVGKASRVLRDVLPILDAEPGPIDMLSTLVDERVQQAVEQWRGRVDVVVSEPMREFVSALLPFQVPYTVARELEVRPRGVPREMLMSGGVELHLARRGDTAARRAILRGEESRVWRANERLLPIVGLEWWIGLEEVSALQPEDFKFVAANCKEAFRSLLEAPHEGLRRLLRIWLQRKDVRAHIDDDLGSGLDAFEAGPVAAIEWLLYVRPPLWEHEPTRSEILLGLAEMFEAREFLRNLIAVDPAQLPVPVQRKLFQGTFVAPQEKFKGPKLAFEQLETLSRLRHDSLLLLAKLGDFAPLRASIDQNWQVHSPAIAREHAHWSVFVHALGQTYGSPDLPVVTDDIWKCVLEFLGWGSIDEQYQSHRYRTRWTLSPDDSTEKLEDWQRRVSVLALHGSPNELRWSLLAPFASVLWSLKDNGAEEVAELWRILREHADPTGANDRWSEPPDLREERREWALRHDEETIRAWCQESFDRQKLIDDLDELGDFAWPHLSEEQRVELFDGLRSLYELRYDRPLGEAWLSRAHNLPLDKRLEFFRKYGTLQQRRETALICIKAETDPGQKVDKWLWLRAEERPPVDFIDEELAKFIKELPQDGLEGYQAAQCRAILSDAPSPDRVLRLLPRVIASTISEEIKAFEISDEHQNPEEQLARSAFRKIHRWDRELEPVLREMGEKLRSDLTHRIGTLKSRLPRLAQRKFGSDAPQFIHPLEKGLEQVVSDIEASTERSPWARVQDLDEAKGQLDSLRRTDGEDILHGTVERLFVDLSADETTELVAAVLERSELAHDFVALGEFMLMIDHSSLSPDGALDAASKLLHVAEQQLTEVADAGEGHRRRHQLVAELLATATLIRHLPLRKALRRCAKQYIAGGNAP